MFGIKYGIPVTITLRLVRQRGDCFFLAKPVVDPSGLAGPESADFIKFLLCYLELCAADVVI